MTAALAVVTAQQFYGDLLTIVGSVFVLWGFLTHFMTEAWNKRLAVLGAILLAAGADLALGSELTSYTAKHATQKWLTLGVLVLIGAALLGTVLRKPANDEVGGKVAAVEEEQSSTRDPLEGSGGVPSDAPPREEDN